jgi:KDO2-lipid IV(A) lauroyltransferase
VLEAGLKHANWPAAQKRGARLGELAWRLAKRDRRRTLEHLALAFPQMPMEQRKRLGRDSFRHYGMCLAELLYLRARPAGEALSHIEILGGERLSAARQAAGPILVLTGHCGNWELISSALAGLGLATSAIARKLDDSPLDKLLVAARAHFGTQTIARGEPGAARQMLAALRGGRALAILIDQDTPVDGVWVPFFGRPAYTPVAAHTLATRFAATVLPIFGERLESGRHLVSIHPPLAVATDAVVAVTAMSQAIEAQIRRQPAQWVWMHRRWRRQPPSS